MPPKSAAEVAVFGSPPPVPGADEAALSAEDMALEPSLMALDAALLASVMALVAADAADDAAAGVLEAGVAESDPQAAADRARTASPATMPVRRRAERTGSSS